MVASAPAMVTNTLPHKMSNCQPKRLIVLLTREMETKKAMDKYQSASITPASEAIDHCNTRLCPGCKNWLNTAKKNSAIFGFRNTMRKPLLAWDQMLLLSASCPSSISEFKSAPASESNLTLKAVLAVSYTHLRAHET